MEYFLQILGSIASIGSIPLAIYLYLKSREAKYANVRREIVRVLSFQIGEGRDLTTFEVQAVIESKIREHRLKPKSITAAEIVEDLVSETISSPMLHGNQKSEIVESLRRIYSKGMILHAIEKYHLSYQHFLKALEPDVELTLKDIARREVAVSEEMETVQTRPRVADIFGLIGAVLTVTGTIISIVATVSSGWIQRYFGREIFFNILLGLAGSVAAALITHLLTRWTNDSESDRKRRRKKRPQRE